MNGDRFQNRVEAGGKLAAALKGEAGRETLVVALPRGGVPVAAEIARELDAPLDILVARKIGAPGHPEYAIGAVAPNGVRVVDDAAVRSMNLSVEDLARLADRARDEAAAYMRRYAGGRSMPEVRGRKVLVVDDGLATGSTAAAAVEALRAAGASEVVLAVPVGAPDSVTALQERADRVVCLRQPVPFQAVGLWYEDFGQTTDEEVLELLGTYGTEDLRKTGGAS